jgi:hypothetical protein
VWPEVVTKFYLQSLIACHFGPFPACTALRPPANPRRIKAMS